MKYMSTGIIDTNTIQETAGAALGDIRGLALKYDGESGKVVKCSVAGETVLGIGILTNDEDIAADAQVNIQIQAIGVAMAGDTVAKGDPLTTNENARLVKASTGNFVIGYALADAVAGGMFKVQVCKGATL